MSRDKGLAGEVLSSTTHLTTLEEFESSLEAQRAVNYEVYQDRQTKLSQEQIQPEEISTWTEQRDKAFFEHMIAVKWHRSRVPHLRDFQHIASLSSSELSTVLKSELEKNSKITNEYIDNIERFIQDRDNVSRSISKLEAQKRSLESQAAAMVISTVSKLFLDPFLIGSKKKISDLHNQLTELESQLSNQRTEFQQKWQAVFDDYKMITREELAELKKHHHIYQALSSNLRTMEAAIAAFPSQALGDHYAQFKQDSSQYNLMRFCEQAIQCGYDERLKTGQNPLADVIPTLKRLYPELSSDLQKLSTTLTTNLNNRDTLLLLQNDMIKKNASIQKELENSKASITALEYKLANLSPLTLMSSLIGLGEKEELTKQLTHERKSLEHLSLAYQNRKQLIVRLGNFLSNKSGNNLYQLYRYAQQDRTSNQERDTIARCLETSYPNAIQELLADSQQQAANIPRRNLSQFITEYLSDLKKIQIPKTVSTPQERALATSLDKFITGQQSWEQFGALQRAINNYPQYREHAVYKPLIDSIMAFCVVATPLPRHYVPKVVVMPVIEPSKAIEASVHVEDIETDSAQQSKTVTLVEEPMPLSTDYTDFMVCLAEINSEKIKSKDTQNLGPLYRQRYDLFERFMNEEFDARGRQRALYHLIVRLNKKQGKSLDELYQKLQDTNPLKVRIFEFLAQPTWHHLEDLKHAISQHPEYYQDETLEALLSEMMTMLVQSVESTRSRAINNHLGSQGHFTRRAIQEHNKALHKAIQAYDEKEHVSNDAQWDAIKTVGKLTLDALELLIKQPGSPNYVELLSNIKIFVTVLTTPAGERLLNEADFHALQTNLQALTAPTNPIRIATEFLLTTAQKTQKYTPKRVDVAQQTLHAKIEKILHPNDPSSNASKWKAVFDVIPLMNQYRDETEDESEQTTVENCIPIAQQIITIIQSSPENSELLELPFTQLNTFLETVHNQPFKDAVAESMSALKKTNEYHAVTATNADKWNNIFQLFLLLDDYSDTPQDKAEQAIFKPCMLYIERLMTIIRDQPEDRALLETLLLQLDEILAPVNHHPFKEGVQHIVAIMKQTDDYDMLMNPPSASSTSRA